MSKITLTPLVNLQNETTAVNAINANNAIVQTAFDNNLSRDGTFPNTMGNALDMNSNQIINLPSPLSGDSPLRLTDASILNGGGTIANIPPGGATGSVLAKNSTTDYDISWKTEASELVAGTNISLTGTSPTTITVIPNPVFSTSVTTPSLVLNGTAVSAFTGTGSIVLATSPTTSGLTNTGTLTAAAANVSGILASSNTTSGTSTSAAAITGKSLGLTENLWIGGTAHIVSSFISMGTQLGTLGQASTIRVYDSGAAATSYGFGVEVGGTLTANSQVAHAWYVTGTTPILTGTTTSVNVPLATVSSSTTTGALVVTGGIGSAGQITGGAIVSVGPILSTGTQGVGYSVGAGGAVTQISSRATGVTLSKTTGAITLLAAVNAAVSAATAVTFTVTNTLVAATDTVTVSQKSGTDKYQLFVTNVAAGSFAITFYTTGGTTNESPVFNFNVIKGAAS